MLPAVAAPRITVAKSTLRGRLRSLPARWCRTSKWRGMARTKAIGRMETRLGKGSSHCNSPTIGVYVSTCSILYHILNTTVVQPHDSRKYNDTANYPTALHSPLPVESLEPISTFSVIWLIQVQSCPYLHRVTDFPMPGLDWRVAHSCREVILSWISGTTALVEASFSLHVRRYDAFHHLVSY